MQGLGNFPPGGGGGVIFGWNGLAFFGNVNFNINNSLIFPASEGLHCKPAPLCDGYPLI